MGVQRLSLSLQSVCRLPLTRVSFPLQRFVFFTFPKQSRVSAQTTYPYIQRIVVLRSVCYSGFSSRRLVARSYFPLRLDHQQQETVTAPVRMVYKNTNCYMLSAVQLIRIIPACHTRLLEFSRNNATFEGRTKPHTTMLF